MARRHSWTQPSCEVCFVDRNPGREPVRLREPEREVCVFCGQTTEDGIYVRVDPSTAEHPTLRK